MSKEKMETGAHDLNMLAGYVEGRLHEEERAAFVAHLAECRECRDTLAEYMRATEDAEHAATGGRFGRARVWLPLAAMLVAATTVGLTVLRLADDRTTITSTPPAPPPASAPSPSATPRADAPATGEASEPPAPAAKAPEPPRIDREFTRLRGAERQIGGKRFVLIAGEWVDGHYDPFDVLPVVEARTPEERAALLERIPSLRPYAALGRRVTVVHEGTVYKLGAE